MKNKYKCFISDHAKDMCLKRYNLHVDAEMASDFADQIISNKAKKIFKRKDGRRVYRVIHQEKPIVIVFCRQNLGIITFLPIESRHLRKHDIKIFYEINDRIAKNMDKKKRRLKSNRKIKKNYKVY